jgi:hypothetical protein
MKMDEKLDRQITIAHIHGILIGMDKDLDFVEFTRKWVALCKVAGINKTLTEDDMELFKVIDRIHLRIIDGTLDSVKDKELPMTIKEDLLELANLIK